MPKRRKSKSLHRITADAVAAWRAKDERALRVALGQKPWEFSPLNVEGECPYPGIFQKQNWQEAQELRSALKAASDDLPDPEPQRKET